MDPFFTEEIQAWFELVLLWVGFGTCVGLLAKAIMPGRDPGGAIATLLMGITGVVIGCGVYSLIYDERLSPISSVGLVCGTLGAFVILLFYRLLGGFLLNESSGPQVEGRPGIWRAAGAAGIRRRRRYSHFLEE